MKKITIFLVLAIFCRTTASSQFFSRNKVRKDVPTTTGVLTLHPDSITIKGKENILEFCFLDPSNKCLFITSNKNMYDSIVLFLPIRTVEGRTVILVGTAINPFSFFSKKRLDELSKNLGISLNFYKVVRIFSYGLSHGLNKRWN